MNRHGGTSWRLWKRLDQTLNFLVGIEAPDGGFLVFTERLAAFFNMDLSNVLVCSFYTADTYYRGYAEKLRIGLERLDIAHELLEIEKAPGEEWPDICRKKIPFLAGVCEKHPDKKVFWIDVDCELLDLPKFVAEFSGDIIGFQRGFGTPLSIGYGNRTRFWEPCFFGINTTTGGRKFVDDAKELEASSEVRATDDYFFEESWRANARHLSFQLIPSICVEGKSEDNDEGTPAFFSFGASGNVAEFKDKVVQHGRISAPGVPAFSLGQSARSAAIRSAKAIERRLPNAASDRLRQLADSTGATQVLTGGGADALTADPSAALLPGSRHRKQIVEQMIMAAQRGEVEKMNEAFVRLTSSGIPTTAEILAKRTSESFAHYAHTDDDRVALQVAWWPRPFPGNFGDWLSPLVVSELSGHPVKYLSPTARSSEPHIVGIGSIGRFIKSRSIVVGTGVSSDDTHLEMRATYISVRGPITASLLAQSGGPTVESFGDPGVLLSRILPMERGETNGRLALVRHYTHAKAPLLLPEDIDELDVLMSHPDAIRTFVENLHEYDGVITSAMHVMIVCHSYGIPCTLINFEGFEYEVHGTGIKYKDYSLGAGLESVHEPTTVRVDLRREDLRGRLSEVRISEGKLDEVENAVREAVKTYIEQPVDSSARR